MNGADMAVFVSDGGVVAGGRGDVWLRVDQTEHTRRQAAGLGAVPSVPVLDALLNLPVGERVPWKSLTDMERERLRDAPAGCWHRNESGVLRLLRTPCTVDLVVVTDHRWRRGLSRACAFTGWTRVLHLPADPGRPLSCRPGTGESACGSARNVSRWCRRNRPGGGCGNPPRGPATNAPTAHG